MENKNRAGTKHCPGCGKVIMKSSDLRGDGEIISRCPHCGKNYKVKLSLKTAVEITLIVLILSIIIPWVLNHSQELLQYVTEQVN